VINAAGTGPTWQRDVSWLPLTRSQHAHGRTEIKSAPKKYPQFVLFSCQRVVLINTTSSIQIIRYSKNLESQNI
jgi:hypothetical protein